MAHNVYICIGFSSVFRFGGVALGVRCPGHTY